MGAAISFLDPSWRRLSDQVLLDSDWEYNLRYLYPPVLSGVTSVWFGIGHDDYYTWLSMCSARINDRQGVYRVFNFLTFFSLVAAFSAFLLVTLYYAISWQINNLHLKYTVWQLFIFLSVAGGILFSAVFYRIVPHIPESQERSMIGIVALTMGATIVFPGYLVFDVLAHKKLSWLLLLISTLGVCLFIGYLVLFGDFFNPWFTSLLLSQGCNIKSSFDGGGRNRCIDDRTTFFFHFQGAIQFLAGSLRSSWQLPGFLDFYHFIPSENIPKSRLPFCNTTNLPGWMLPSPESLPTHWGWVNGFISGNVHLKTTAPIPGPSPGDWRRPIHHFCRKTLICWS